MILSFVFVFFPVIALMISAWLESLVFSVTMIAIVCLILTSFAIAKISGRDTKDRPTLMERSKAVNALGNWNELT